MPHFTGRLSALNHHNYFVFWSGSFASVGATQLQIMAQGWLLFELTESTIALGYLGAAASIPAIIMTLYGGAIADRLNKKHVLMATSLAVAALLISLAVLDASALVRPWHVILVAGLISFTSGFDWPTRQAILPALIDRQDMMSAVALNSIIWQSCRMVMPAIGGIIIALVDTWLVFLLCSIGFLIMFAVIAGLKVSLPALAISNSATHQVKEGLLFILHNRIFLLLISLSYAAMFFGMAHIQLMPAFTALLETNEQGYGFLISATGIGSVLGTIIVGNFQHSKQLGALILASTATSGIMIYMFALVTAFATELSIAFELAVLFATLASMFASMFLISTMTVLQLRVPDELRGRVMGFHGITFSLMALGGLLAGWIASFSSAPVAVATGITVYLAIIIWVAISQREIRSISAQTPA